MLRSSRQGRKIASRYHASSSSNNLKAELNDSTSIQSFYRRLVASRGEGRVAMNGAITNSQSQTSLSSQLSNDSQSHGEVDIDVHVQQPSPVKDTLPVSVKRQRPSHLNNTLHSSAFAYDGNTVMPYTPSLSEGAASATSTAMTMEWSRETSTDSASLHEGTATSSPPPLLVGKELTQGPDGGWQESDDNDDALSSSSTLTDEGEFEQFTQRSSTSASIDRFDLSEDTSRIAGRPRRAVSKTIKQLEAEESLSLTPRRKRKSRSTATLSPHDARSQPHTPRHERIQESTPSPITGTPESSVLSEAPMDYDFDFLTQSPSKEQSEVPVRRRGRKPRSRKMDDGTSETFDSQTSANRSQKPLWKRKVFLTSGLYSDDHKVNDTVKVPTRKSFLSSQKERLQHGTERTRAAGIRRSAFPLPTDFGYWVLTEKRDYRLPFPIAEEIGEIREKMASKRKPPAYKHISQNKYYSRPKLPGEIMVCQCPPTGTCDENCMNRQTQYLCHPKLCPCGDRCTNIQFGKRKPIKTEVHWYGARGFGLRTLEPIAKDSFIDEYRGEVISYNEMVRRVRDHYKDTGNYYFLMYDAPAGEMLDGGLKGNITRYANHSCDPNCKIQKWIVCGTDEQCAAEFQVALYAGRDIAAGEELTYDYGWSAFSPKSVTGDGDINDGEACHCGAANCSGVMGRKGTTSTSSSNNNPSNTAAALRSGPARRKRKYKKRLALRRQKELAQAIGDQKQEKDDSGVTTESKSVALEQAAQEQSASTVKGRTYVRDRVSIGIRPMPTQLIDSDNVPILEGKRSRKSSTLSFADLEHTVAARPRKRGRHSNPLPSTNKSTAAHESASTMSMSASMVDITSSSSSFDMSNYPPGTKFYNRNGEDFDFSTLLLKRRGKKPKPYTRQELEEANERHRLNLKRLNDLRKFK